MATFVNNIPVPGSAGTFDVPGGSSITGGNGSHGTVVTCGTTGKWLAGSSLLGRKLCVVHDTLTIGSSVTEAKVYLYVADDANGTNAAAVSGAVATITIGTPTVCAKFPVELPLDSVVSTKYYGLGVSWKASAGTNNTGTGGTCAVILDPTYVS